MVSAGARAPSMTDLARRIFETQGWNLPSALRECERQAFELALECTDGNQSKAARLLGVTPRTVYNKVRKHHLPA